MPDQTLQLLIETIYKGDGTKATLQDLRRLVQETNAGSKEAAAALDHWRATYGKLRNEMAAGFGNTGAGLATAARLPYSGPVPPVIPTGGGGGGPEGMGSAMRRHFGAMAGQVLGMPGLGMMAAVGGMAAGIGAATLALEKLVRIFADFNAKVDQGVASMRQFELAGLHIDSLAVRTQKLTQQNKEFAFAYSQIERQVHTVSSEIKNLLDLETNQIAVEQRLDDATTQRALSESALRNRFNPVAAIKEREAIEEAAFARRMQRERDQEQAQLRSLELHEKLTAARGARYSQEKQELQQQLGPMQAAADSAAYNEQATQQDVLLKVAAVEKMRAALIRLREGRDITLHDTALAGDEMEALGLPNLRTAEGKPWQISASLLQADKIQRQLEDRVMSAKAARSATAFSLKEQEDKIKAANQEIQNSKTEFEQKDIERQVLEEKIKQTSPVRDAAEEAIKGSLRARETIELQNIQSTGATGGFGANSETNDLLRQILAVWQA